MNKETLDVGENDDKLCFVEHNFKGQLHAKTH